MMNQKNIGQKLLDEIDMLEYDLMFYKHNPNYHSLVKCTEEKIEQKQQEIIELYEFGECHDI